MAQLPSPAPPPEAALTRALAAECRLLVDRLRGFTAARLSAAAGPFADRAAVVRHLAQRLVDLAGVPRRLPELPATALADQLAVTAHDLLAAGPDGPTAAAALAEVLVHRRDVDGADPGPTASALVLAVLAPGAEPTPAALLREARQRCPVWAGPTGEPG